MIRNKRRNKRFLLLLLLLGITIGFGALATTLKINGTTVIKKNTWGIYWDNIANESGVTPAQDHGASIGPDEYNNPKSKVTFDVTFDKPGDYYEFTVDAVNSGSIDAKVISFEKKYNDAVIDEDNPLPSYLKYTITYLDGTEIKIGDQLPQAPDLTSNPQVLTRKTVRVRVEYDKNAVTNSDINGQTSDVSHSFSFEIKYGQDPNPDLPDEVAAIMTAIEANPNAYRDPDQDSTNKDIAIDKNGNVINLDVWTANNDSCFHNDYTFTNKAYGRKVVGEDENKMPIYADEIVLGAASYDKDDPNGLCLTPATAEANIINGEMIYEMPAYILLDGADKFYPVTETYLLFANVFSFKTNVITKIPDFPPTIKKIGRNTFDNLKSFESIVIPKEIKEIDEQAFVSAFNYSGANNTVTFEAGSRLVNIGATAFYHNNLSGTITLPQKLKRVEKDAFEDNNLTSVRIPTATHYVSGDSSASFDDGVTIIQY